MSYKNKSKNIGQMGTLEIRGMNVRVEVLDYKHSYGRDRWLVTPLEGSGEVWVEGLTIEK